LFNFVFFLKNVKTVYINTQVVTVCDFSLNNAMTKRNILPISPPPCHDVECSGLSYNVGKQVIGKSHGNNVADLSLFPSAPVLLNMPLQAADVGSSTGVGRVGVM
jgi:hypothetical protein